MEWVTWDELQPRVWVDGGMKQWVWWLWDRRGMHLQVLSGAMGMRIRASCLAFDLKILFLRSIIFMKPSMLPASSSDMRI